MAGVNELAQALRALPKVELHCHVEGTMRPETVAELAGKNGVPLPAGDVRELYRYGSLDEFLSIFWLVQSVLADAGDWARLGYESVLDGAAAGRVYAEVFVTPARHLAAGQSLGSVLEGLAAGLAAGDAETGCQTRVIVDMDKAYGPAAGQQLVAELIELRRAGAPGTDRVLGIGMDSTELNVDPLAFAPAYRDARAAGLRRTGHQGENSPAAAVFAVAASLGAERVDHGLSLIDDPGLVAYFADRRIPLTMCPTSNVVIANAYPSVARHPLPALREAGVLVTVNTDDPALTDLDLAREYANCAAAWDWGWDQMVGLALDGVEATWLDEPDKRALSARVRAAAEQLRPASALAAVAPAAAGLAAAFAAALAAALAAGVLTAAGAEPPSDVDHARQRGNPGQQAKAGRAGAPAGRDLAVSVVPAVRAAGAARPEHAVHRAGQLAHQQRPHQPVVSERGLVEGEPDAEQRVLAQAARLGHLGAGRRQRVPGAAGLVGRQVLDRVDQVGDPAEEPPRLRQRRDVAGRARQDRGVREGGGGGRLGRLGDRQQAGARPGGGLDRRLAADGLGQHRDLEPEPLAGPRAGGRPPAGQRGRRAPQAGAAERAVAVVGVVAQLGRRQHQGHGGGEPGAVTGGDVRPAQPAQRAPARGAPFRRARRLRLGQHRDHQAVVVGGQPGRLPVVVAQRQAQPAQVGLPGRPQFAEPVAARPDDPEHLNQASHRAASPAPPYRTRGGQRPRPGANHRTRVRLTQRGRPGHDQLVKV